VAIPTRRDVAGSALRHRVIAAERSSSLPLPCFVALCENSSLRDSRLWLVVKWTPSEFSPFVFVPWCAAAPCFGCVDVVSHKGTKTQRLRAGARSPGIERSEIANRRLPEGQRRRALATAMSSSHCDAPAAPMNAATLIDFSTVISGALPGSGRRGRRPSGVPPRSHHFQHVLTNVAHGLRGCLWIESRGPSSAEVIRKVSPATSAFGGILAFAGFARRLWGARLR
jgi:hypothetical protein